MSRVSSWRYISFRHKADYTAANWLHDIAKNDTYIRWVLIVQHQLHHHHHRHHHHHNCLSKTFNNYVTLRGGEGVHPVWHFVTGRGGVWSMRTYACVKLVVGVLCQSWWLFIRLSLTVTANVKFVHERVQCYYGRISRQCYLAFALHFQLCAVTCILLALR